MRVRETFRCERCSCLKPINERRKQDDLWVCARCTYRHSKAELDRILARNYTGIPLGVFLKKRSAVTGE